MIVSLIKEDGFVKNKKRYTSVPIYDKLNLKFGLYCKNQQVGSVSGNIIENKLNTVFNFMGSNYYVEHEDYKNVDLKSTFGLIKDSFIGNHEELMNFTNDLFDFKLKDDNENNIGSLQYKAEEVNGKVDYYYFVLNIDGYSLNLYFVRNSALKGQSSYYCIYYNNELIAISENPNVLKKTISSGPSGFEKIVDNQQFEYDIYIKNDSMAKYICLFVYLIHVINYENSHEINAILSNSSALSSKFNPNFINEIRAGENSNFLPENMSIIKDKFVQQKKFVQKVEKNWLMSLLLFLTVAFLIFIFAFSFFVK